MKQIYVQETHNSIIYNHQKNIGNNLNAKCNKDLKVNYNLWRQWHIWQQIKMTLIKSFHDIGNIYDSAK